MYSRRGVNTKRYGVPCIVLGIVEFQSSSKNGICWNSCPVGCKKLREEVKFFAPVPLPATWGPRSLSPTVNIAHQRSLMYTRRSGGLRRAARAASGYCVRQGYLRGIALFPPVWVSERAAAPKRQLTMAPTSSATIPPSLATRLGALSSRMRNSLRTNDRLRQIWPCCVNAPEI